MQTVTADGICGSITYYQLFSPFPTMSGCVCHGYLETYAALWTGWRLFCENDTSVVRTGRLVSGEYKAVAKK